MIGYMHFEGTDNYLTLICLNILLLGVIEIPTKLLFPTDGHMETLSHAQELMIAHQP